MTDILTCSISIQDKDGATILEVKSRPYMHIVNFAHSKSQTVKGYDAIALAGTHLNKACQAINKYLAVEAEHQKKQLEEAEQNQILDARKKLDPH